QMVGFIFMLGVTMVAAPGVPGGAIMAATGILGSMLGFSEADVALMIATYIALDPFGTATNVTGDGAISMIVDKLADGKITTEDVTENAQDFDGFRSDSSTCEGVTIISKEDASS
ncbi:MAG: cation:dicarboxylase symporter family transporter, partial [Actinomycetaceae bacterium]|nr:cation:dicarboxylase symporter family transporter [Actinomycetaceae bacterium]